MGELARPSCGTPTVPGARFRHARGASPENELSERRIVPPRHPADPPPSVQRFVDGTLTVQRCNDETLHGTGWPRLG